LETNVERLYRLCMALLKGNLADEKLWQRTGKVAAVFARSAIQKLIEEFAGARSTTRLTIASKSETTLRQDIGEAELSAKSN
jgi:hypothetical protein